MRRVRIAAILVGTPLVACSLVAGLDKDFVKVDCLGAACATPDSGNDASSSTDAPSNEDAPTTTDGGTCPGIDAAAVESNDDFAGFRMPNSGSAEPNRHDWDLTSGGADVIIDKITGLKWQKHPSSALLDPAGAAAFCTALAPAGEWRVPTRLELLTIQHWNPVDPVSDRPTPCFAAGTFEEHDGGPAGPTRLVQSATLYADRDAGTFERWGVATDLCGPVPTLFNQALPVRCVSGNRPKPQFDVTSKCGIVRDMRSRLEWQRELQGNKSYKKTDSTESIFDYCNKLQLGPPGDTMGWRVPTTQEIYSIIDTRRMNPAMNPLLFGNLPAAGRLLASTLYGLDGKGSTLVAGLFLEDGQQDSFEQSQVGFVSCVRGFRD